MPRNRYSDVCTNLLFDLICQFIRYGRVLIVGHLIFIFLLGKCCIFFGNGTLCNGENCEAFFRLIPLLNCLTYFIDIIRNLRNENDICTTRNSGMKRQPAYFVTHDFHDEYTSMGSCRCMDAVNTLRCNIYCTLKTKGHICPPDIIINCLRKMNDIQTFFAEQISCFLRSISTKNYQAVQVQSLVILFHGCYLIKPVLIWRSHCLK